MSTASLTFHPIDPQQREQIETVVNIWNQACSDDLAITPHFAEFNLQPATGCLQAAIFAYKSGEPVGFTTVSFLTDDPLVSPPTQGWINAIAVLPTFQRQGIGRALLDWAEGWLVGQGCRSILLGAGLRPFLPGIPLALNTAPFFIQRGYGERAQGEDSPNLHQETWDVAANLATYSPPETVREVPGQARPARAEDYDAVLEFLQREFPGGWRYTFQEHVRRGGRIADYMVLWTERGVDGTCLLTFEDSVQPIERYYPYRLPKPWGNLGCIGVSADQRGRGFGAALLDAGLRRLQNNGVRGCVIDWTDLLDFYGKFGFTPYRHYLRLSKTL